MLVTNGFFYYSLFFEFDMSKEQILIDFDGMTFQEKRAQIIKGILIGTNYNDAFANTLDWSTSEMQLNVPSIMVLEFDRICSRLVGKKTLKEMFDIVFGFV